MEFFLLLQQAESSVRSLVFEGVGAAFEVRVALVPDRGKRQNNNIEIAYFIGAWRFFFPILIPQFKLS